MKTVKRYCKTCHQAFEFKASWVHKPNAGRYCGIACRAAGQRAILAPAAVWKHIENCVEFEPNTGCWLWSRGTDQDGYGALKREGYSTRAHRASWEIHCGPILDGSHVLHRCDTPRCVNPGHLFLGTHTDNMRDMAAKGRQRGPRKAGSGLNPKGGPA